MSWILRACPSCSGRSRRFWRAVSSSAGTSDSTSRCCVTRRRAPPALPPLARVDSYHYLRRLDERISRPACLQAVGSRYRGCRGPISVGWSAICTCSTTPSGCCALRSPDRVEREADSHASMPRAAGCAIETPDTGNVAVPVGDARLVGGCVGVSRSGRGARGVSGAGCTALGQVWRPKIRRVGVEMTNQLREWCRGEDLNLHRVAPTWT